MKIRVADKMLELLPGREAPTDLLKMLLSNVESFGDRLLKEGNGKPIEYYTCTRIDREHIPNSIAETIYHYRYQCPDGIRSVFEFKINKRFVATAWRETPEEEALPTDFKTLQEAVDLSLDLTKALLTGQYKEVM